MTDDEPVDAEWLTAAGFALADSTARFDYWDGPWTAYSGAGSARRRTRLLYWTDQGFLIEQETVCLTVDGDAEDDLVAVPGPATRARGAALLALFPPAGPGDDTTEERA